MRHLVFIMHNLRSAHNVGALLRTCDGLGVEAVWLTGYSPYPLRTGDRRLPHLAQKVDRQIAKTALGAEQSVTWRHNAQLEPAIAGLKRRGFMIVGLEQTPQSTALPGFRAPDKVVLIAGREVEGLEPEVLELCDQLVEIPMFGQKESYNVAAAAAMALYQFRFLS